MRDVLTDLERTEAHAAGSWDPDPNWIGDVGGRVYATALAVLTLEIYYRIRGDLNADAVARDRADA
jgi:hypothetical protein